MNNYAALSAGIPLASQAAPPRRRLFGLSWGTLVASLVVGTVLILVNHADTLFAGHASLSLTWIVPLTYLLSLILVVSSGSLVSPGAGGHEKART